MISCEDISVLLYILQVRLAWRNKTQVWREATEKIFRVRLLHTLWDIKCHCDNENTLKTFQKALPGSLENSLSWSKCAS